MAGIKFYLEKRKDKSGELITVNVPIFLFYSFNGNRLQYFTGERVDAKNYIPEYWKQNKEPIKKIAQGSEKINRNLATLKLHIENIHSDAKALGIVPTIEYFRTNLNKLLKGVPEIKELTVLGVFKLYLDRVKETKAHNTYRSTNTFYNHLDNFLGKRKLRFSEIDSTFVDSLKRHLSTDHLNNTVAKNLRIFRTFLNWCKTEGYFKNDNLKIDAKENDIEVIFLSYHEIMKLHGTIFTAEKIEAVRASFESVKDISVSTSTLERVRDVFVFGCFTGMRYSDIAKLRKSDVQEKQVKFYITKGGHTTSQTVPLIQLTKDILDRYKDAPGDQALPVISNQKMNDYLKVIGKIAEFNEVITLAKKQGNGKIKEVLYPKHELITCHTSRKSFCVVSMTRGMPENVVKSITGHSKNSKAFSKYYDIIDSHKQDVMNKIF